MRFKPISKKSFCIFALLPTIAAFGVNFSAFSENEIGNSGKPMTAYNEILNTREGEMITYSEYIKKHLGVEKPVENITFSAKEAKTNNTEITVNQQNETVLSFNQDGSAEWSFNAASDGLYKIKLKYYFENFTEKDISNPAAKLKINGEIPFQGANNFELGRYWVNEEKRMDSSENELIPEQLQKSGVLTRTLVDSTGIEGEYYFYFNKGENKLELFVDDSNFFLIEFMIFNEKNKSFEEYKSEFEIRKSNNAEIFIQAEDQLYKNDSSLIPAADRSGPATMPNDPVKMRLNIVSGNSFKKPGQIMVYEFDAPKNGAYKIGARFRQNQLEGMFVNRKILIDGEIPYDDFSQLRFEYNNSWQYKDFGDLIYLTAGPHTISMEVSEPESGGIAKKIEDCVYVLNYIYRKIIMITTTQPDTFRDYNLPSEIPFLIDAFKESAAELRDIYDEVINITGNEGGQFSSLIQVAAQLDSFIAKPDTITERLESYKANISVISALMLNMQEQPLDIDYFCVRGTESEKPKANAGFFEGLFYGLKVFIGSFFNDYISVGTDINGEKSEEIKVWFNGGREQAEIIKQIIDSEFSSSGTTAVKLELVQIPISQAVLAGRAPDVVLNSSRLEPVNLAARGVLKDLTEFPDFDTVATWFNKDSFLPYQYKTGTCGIPVTLDFHMMFYRTDVLAELGIEPPKTWDEFYRIVPIIQKANLEIGMPYTATGSQGINDAGILPTLLIQQGGTFYNDQNKNIVLDSPEMLSSFKEWCELYTKFHFQLQYDFYNRFRSGEMPIGIQNYNIYNMLVASAPEINGLWDMTTIPGTQNADGTINISETANGAAALMIKNTKHPDAAWSFLKWWCSAEVQAKYGNRLEMLMGKASRYNPAATEAIALLPWTENQVKLLTKQRAAVVEVPEVVGGYYSARGIDNAFKNVVLNKKNYREELLQQSVIINNELTRKRKEFGLD